MFLTLLGTPSPLTAAVLKTVQVLVECLLGNYHWIAAGTSDDLRKAWVDRGERPIVMFADIPSRDITNMLIDAKLPLVVCIEPPAAIVEHLARTRNLTGLPALRLASQSLATLHNIALNPAAYRLPVSIADATLEEVVEGLAHIYGLALDMERRAEIMRRLRGGRNIDSLREMSASEQTGTQSHEPMPPLDSLDGYDALIGGRPVQHFVWQPHVFLGAKPMGEPLAGPIELIGARRCFLFGPYFHLPPGLWTITVDFTIAGNISGNVLKIDAYTDRIIEERSTRLPPDGRFACSIDVTIDEPRLPLQIRLFTEEGAIEGRVTLHGVAIKRIR